MDRGDFTYEQAPAGTSSEGLEGYTLEDASGETRGRVIAVLDNAGSRWIAYSRGAPPFPGPMRAVPLDALAEIDHDALVLTLRSGPVREIELDEAQAVEARADAARVTDAPGAPAYVDPESGPTDRARGPAHVALFVVGFVLTLGVVAVATVVQSPWLLLVALVPGAVLVAGLLLGLATLRDPYDR